MNNFFFRYNKLFIFAGIKKIKIFSMRMYKALIAAIIVTISFSFNVSAQKSFTTDADEAFKNNQYYDAISIYKKAYSKLKSNKTEKARVIYQIAECYRLNNNPAEAIKWYERAMGRYQENILLYHYAEMLRQSQRYDDAIAQYKAYEAKVPNDPKGKIGEESCELAKKWKDNPTRYKVKDVNEAYNNKYNSKQNDFAPFYIDQKTFNSYIFTSGRETSTGRKTDAWTGESFFDIYTARKARNGQWDLPMSIGTPINTEFSEGAACYNRKATELYFTKCSREKKKKTNCEILSSKLVGSAWDEPKQIALVPDSFSAGDPFISDDELSLYFASDVQPGGFGGKDIWVAKRNSTTEQFGKPENLGTNINTTGDDMFPYIRSTGDFYYASNGLVGMGGLDIYKSSRKGNEWGKPEIMLPPINSSADDFAIVFQNENERGLFSSNRNGKTGDDIYFFWLPNLVYSLKGTVKDDSTKLPIEFAIVKVTDSDGKTFEGKTDKDGVYKFDTTQILPKKTYSILFTKEPQYLASKGQTTTVGLEESKELILDKNLVPIPKKPIVLPDILYDVDKWDLKPQYQDSLNGLFQTLSDNPKIVIELSSHTDSRSSDQHNDTLSQRRAQSVVDYLIKKGIDSERLIAKGYGEKQPRILKTNSSVMINGKKYSFKKGIELNEKYINSIKEIDQKEAAYQLNRRTEFKILNQNFVPKPKTEEEIKK